MDSTFAAPRGATGARVLGGLAVTIAAALLWHGPIAQWSDYHAFADGRAWLGVPNAALVLSNIAFAVVAAWELRRLGRRTSPAVAGSAWRLLCIALACTAAGSAYYHWQPSDAALVFDRIPIAWACAAIVAALLAERGFARWAGAPSLTALVALSTLSVLYWGWSGDLRPYLYWQLLPMALVPAALLMRMPAAAADATPDAAWWSVLGCYALAKAMEMLDAPVLTATHLFVSGHTLKHLLAALGAALLLRGARVRVPRPDEDQLR